MPLIFLDMGIIIGFIFGIAITAVILCCILIPKVKETRQFNQTMDDINRQLDEDNRNLIEKLNQLDKESEELSQIVDKLNQQKDNKTKELQDIVQKNNDLMIDAEERAESYKNHYMKQAELEIENKKRQLEEDYMKSEEDFQKEYAESMNAAAADLTNRIGAYKAQIEDQEKDIDAINSLLDNKRAEYKAFIEVLKKNQEDKDKQNFYQLQITPEDIAEIEVIRSIIPKIRNTDPINKIIYKTYYEKAYTDLVGRVVGSTKTCGIYKLTNLTNGMSYIGQSVDIAERWRQHIKCGCGIDAPKNKLYQAMYQDGVENFSFEILEKCDKIQLNDKEKLWINNFDTNSYGYNMTAGGSGK